MPLESRTDGIIPTKILIMGVGVNPFPSYEAAIACLGRCIEQKQQIFIAAINPEKIYRAQSDLRLKALLNDANVSICDGIGAAWAARVLIGRSIPRVTGVALFYELISAAGDRSWRVFLLGAAPDVNEQAATTLLAANPRLNIAGRLDGFFEDSVTAVDAINTSEADIVFVAMGSPKQEVWIQENRGTINASILMGVGGTFDVVSGRVKWAPKIFRKTGTEWLYRLVCEPRRNVTLL